MSLSYKTQGKRSTSFFLESVKLSDFPNDKRLLSDLIKRLNKFGSDYDSFRTIESNNHFKFKVSHYGTSWFDCILLHSTLELKVWRDSNNCNKLSTTFVKLLMCEIGLLKRWGDKWEFIFIILLTGALFKRIENKKKNISQ